MSDKIYSEIEKNLISRKFAPLANYLIDNNSQEVILSFEEIEKLIKETLCASAYKYPEYWVCTRNGKIQNVVNQMGYKLKANLKNKVVVFAKVIKLKSDESVSLMKEINNIYEEIEKISSLLGRPLKKDMEVMIIDRECPHEAPTKLESGWAAVYSFIYKDEFIKIGKANQKSQARYTSQHYGLKAPSTLAYSLCNDINMRHLNITEDNVKQWILNNTHRIDILIKSDDSKWATALIEGIMHFKYRPRYEG